MRSRGLKAVALAGLTLAAARPAVAQEAVGPRSRAEAVKIIEGLREIVSPQGLQAIETIPIGGIKQVVSIRSHDLRTR
jgi:hypothetical protein